MLCRYVKRKRSLVIDYLASKLATGFVFIYVSLDIELVNLQSYAAKPKA